MAAIHLLGERMMKPLAALRHPSDEEQFTVLIQQRPIAPSLQEMAPTVIDGLRGDRPLSESLWHSWLLPLSPLDAIAAFSCSFLLTNGRCRDKMGIV